MSENTKHLSKILSNIKYTIHNYSNYDITVEETRDIIDVPYFPAQNLVDIEGIETHNPTKYIDKFIYLRDKNNNDRILALVNKPDQRLLFIEFQTNARYLLYRFGGTSYPQGRTKYSITHTDNEIYIGFGECNERYVDDIWIYNIDENTWTNINFHIEEGITSTPRPSKRGKTNLVVDKENKKIYIFGGETDILKLHTATSQREFIPLNDIWEYDLLTKTWINYDKKRILPHRQGNIVYVDDEIIKIVIEGGINEVGEYEPLGIWTINKQTNEVSFTEYNDCPFIPSYKNIPYIIDGVIHYLVNDKLYKWNNETNKFELVIENITDVNFKSHNINDNNEKTRFLVVYEVNKERGQDINFGTTKIKECKTFSLDENKNPQNEKIYTITPPVYSDTIPNVNINNYQTIYLLGFVNGKFNENIFILNHKTLDTKKIDIPETQKPQERIYPAICYDRYHNRIWIFGGSDGSKFYNDLWYFDLNTHTFTKVFDEDYAKENGLEIPEPRYRSGIAVVVNGKYLYLIGGQNDEKVFNDFWQFDIENKRWNKITLVDNIPFGSTYYIFEWRDRLFLFNGEPDGLYRLYWSQKQFIKQPFVIDAPSCSDDFLNKVRRKEFLDLPITVKLFGDYLFITSPKFFLKVDLNTRKLEELSFLWNLSTKVYPLDHYKFFDLENMKLIYINVSELQPLTKNQIPNSFYSKKIDEPENSGLFLFDFINDKKLIYYDQSGKYQIQGRRLGLDKAKLILNNEVSIVKLSENDWNTINIDNDEERFNTTLDHLAKPYVYPFTPWFLYNKIRPALNWYDGVRNVIYDEKQRRLFLVYSSGNIIKLNLHDFTMFIYHPNFWEGSAIGYNKIKGKFYCFFGLRDKNKRTPYTQKGFVCQAIEKKCGGQLSQGKKIEQSHCGCIVLDTKVNELSVRSIEDYLREKKVSIIDYTKTRDYLLSLIRRYLEQREQGKLILNENEIKKKIYNATRELVDDISTLNKIYEKGERPLARAYPIYTQIDNKLFIFGGCQSYIQEGEGCQEIKNKPYFTCKVGTLEGYSDEIRDKQSRIAVYYDMDKEEWIYLKELPFWLYLGSAIPTPDKKKIVIVGGYRGENCSNPYNGILIYDIEKNDYFEVKGIPSKYVGRANPILHWIDEHRLLIMYGSRAKLECEESQDGSKSCKYIHLPVKDVWIVDFKNKIMYKAFEDLINLGGISVKDYYAKDEFEELQSIRNQYILIPFPVQQSDGSIIMKLYKYNLINGDVELLKIIPTIEILKDFKFTIKEKENGELSDFGKLSLGD